jgi:hypothetical protein
MSVDSVDMFTKNLEAAVERMERWGDSRAKIDAFVHDHLTGNGWLWHGPVDDPAEAWWFRGDDER